MNFSDVYLIKPIHVLHSFLESATGEPFTEEDVIVRIPPQPTMRMPNGKWSVPFLVAWRVVGDIPPDVRMTGDVADPEDYDIQISIQWTMRLMDGFPGPAQTGFRTPDEERIVDVHAQVDQMWAAQAFNTAVGGSIGSGVIPFKIPDSGVREIYPYGTGVALSNGAGVVAITRRELFFAPAVASRPFDLDAGAVRFLPFFWFRRVEVNDQQLFDLKRNWGTYQGAANLTNEDLVGNPFDPNPVDPRPES